MTKSYISAAMDGILDLTEWYINTEISRTYWNGKKYIVNEDTDQKEDAAEFMLSIVKPEPEYDIAGEEWIRMLNEDIIRKQEGEITRIPLSAIYYLFIAKAFYSKSLKESDINLGWNNVAQAMFWQGKLFGGADAHKSSVVTHLNNANDVKHAENREFKKLFLKWFDEKHKNYGSNKAAILTFIDEQGKGNFRTLEGYLYKK